MNLQNIGGLGDLLDSTAHDTQKSCMDSIKDIPNMLGLLRVKGEHKAEKSTEGIMKFLKFIGTLFLFICIFPLIPIFYLMSIMLAVIKYVLLKLSIL